MSKDTFDLKILSDKLSKLNNSQQSIQSLSSLCISHRKKARQIVETWEKMFNSSEKELCISLLYLANDILQNSRRKGSEFVNEFWKVLPAALKHVYDKCDENGKKAATRLVDIWEERKVFGSRIQSLKDAIGASEVKDPTSQAVSNGKSVNPIKIMKKDSQSLRIKLPVGDFPERIVSAFYSLHEELSNEESALGICEGAVHSAERIAKDVENSIIHGNLQGSCTADKIQEQEDTLDQCIRQLEGAEAIRVDVISQLKDALQDQDVKLGALRDHLQVARSWINDVRTLKPKIQSLSHSVQTPPVGPLAEPLMMGQLTVPAAQVTDTFQVPSSQPVGTPPNPMHQISQLSSQPTTSFASLAATDEESKKAAAAAVAAKLAASTSSAQMLTSVFSSLMAEQAAKMGSPMFPPEKRPKLEQQSSSPNVSNPEAGSSAYFNAGSQGVLPPPPLPPRPPVPATNPGPNQFVQSSGMLLNMMAYGFGGNGVPPPPPPPLPPPHLAVVSPQPLQPPLQAALPQNATGGYYRPPGA